MKVISTLSSQLVSIIHMDDTSTAFATGIVAVIAGLAEGRVFIPGIVIPVDTLTAVGADYSFLIGTAFAKRIVTHQDAAFQRVRLSTVTAGKSFSHHRHSPQSNSRLPRIPVRRQQPAGFQIHPWNPGSVYFHCPNSPFFSLMEITPEQFHAAEHLGFPLKQCESDAANGSAYGIAPFLILIISVQICSLQSQNTAVFSAKQEKSQSPQSSKNYGFWLFIMLIIYG